MQRFSAILLATLTGLVASLVPLAGQADTLYVTDKLYLGVYEQKGEGQMTSITSGTALEVLDDQGAWLRARLPDGSEGWVKSKYLVDEVPAGIRLAELEKELEELREAGGGEAAQEVASLAEEKAALEERLSASQTQLSELREALGAANAAAEAARAESEQLRADLDAGVAGAGSAAQSAADPTVLQTANERAAEAEARVEGLLAQRDELRDREAQLGAELQALRAQVASALSALGGTPGGGGSAESEIVQVAAAQPSEPSPWDFIARLGLQRHTHALYIALAVATLAIGFWLGIRWLDYRIRKRTGGVQIW